VKIKGRRLLQGGPKEVNRKHLSLMFGTENLITHGDPCKIEVIAYMEVSISIVALIYN